MITICRSSFGAKIPRSQPAKDEAGQPLAGTGTEDPLVCQDTEALWMLANSAARGLKHEKLSQGHVLTRKESGISKFSVGGCSCKYARAGGVGDVAEGYKAS